MLGKAILSDDEKYRFWLERPITAGPLWPDPAGKVLVVIGANPSTANADKDDQTMRKEQGFARFWNCSLLVKVNIYGYRATNPKDMWAAAKRGEDIHGDGNYRYIREAVGRAVVTPGSIVLGAWGNIPKIDHVVDVVNALRSAFPNWHDYPDGGIKCLGTNENGSPKHTLYLPYETPLQDWKQAA